MNDSNNIVHLVSCLQGSPVAPAAQPAPDNYGSPQSSAIGGTGPGFNAFVGNGGGSSAATNSYSGGGGSFNTASSSGSNSFATNSDSYGSPQGSSPVIGNSNSNFQTSSQGM